MFDKPNRILIMLIALKPQHHLLIFIVYFKLPYLKLSNFIQGKTRMVVNKYCTNPKLQLQFSSFKIKNLLSVKDHVPRSLRSYVLYRFNSNGCNYVQIGDTSQHLSIRVREYIFTDKNYNIFKFSCLQRGLHQSTKSTSCFVSQAYLWHLSSDRQ